MVEKPSRLYFARAVSLFCSLALLFGGVLHDVAVRFSLRCHLYSCVTLPPLTSFQNFRLFCFVGFFRRRSYIDVHCHRMPSVRTEELLLQLRRHVNETRIPTEDRPQVQEENRADC